MQSQSPPALPSKPSGIARETGVVAERYQLLEEIGRGGLAVVYRVRDAVEAREVALKLLLKHDRAATVALFEREFHTLSQLSHPRIVEAYDYGLSADGGAYYTMELLDGGDVQTLSPLDYRRTCALMRDVCSALCLLHSRRLVHRDISPRNIRCTTDGLAKLIDFGAMIPMGASAPIVGTPPFCAPEVVEMRALDARTDLYSLGTTLYFALCGRHVYPARHFRQLQALWQHPPPSPSQLAPGIPRALDDLVMELIQLDPRSRPANAAVVMERLSAIAGLPIDEQLVVSQAYLSTPTLVGRERKLARARKRLARAKQGTGSALVVEAAPGMGRTRFLDACALEAKLMGFTVARASAAESRAGGGYAAAQAIAAQLLDIHPETSRALAQPYLASLQRVVPELRAEGDAAAAAAAPVDAAQRVAVQQALHAWIAALADRHPLALVVDDADRLDEPSAALLAVLAHGAGKHALAIMASVESGGDARGALGLLRGASATLALDALKPAQTQALLASMFGEVSHLGTLARRLQQITAGNPRDLLHLTQHLVDHGVARYQAGSWTLPESIDAADLPESLARAFEQRVQELSADARELAQAFALTPHEGFTLEECFALGADRRGVLLAALNQLVTSKVLRGEGGYYALSQAPWAAPLLAGLAPERKQALHARLAELFAARGDEFRRGQQLLAAGMEEQALDVLVQHARTSKQETDRDQLAWARLAQTLPRDCNSTYQAALELCEQRKRPATDCYALRTRMSSLLRAFGLDNRAVLLTIVERCKRDAGLDLYDQLDPGLGEGERLKQAFAAAQARHDAQPPAERTFAPLSALQPLNAAIVESLGVASVQYDRTLWRSLPSLQPFRALSPALEVMDRVRESTGERLAGRYGRAREGYGLALERLQQPDRAGLPDAYYYAVRDGMLFARALIESAMGSAAVLDVLPTLETGPFRLGAMWLRVLHCLWRGDGEGAERHRTQLELARVQSSLGLDYEGGLLFTELCALVSCDDLARLRRIMPEVERWASRSASWQPMLCYARGSQRRIGGDLQRALADMREGLRLAAPGEHQLWAMLAGAEVQCLLELGQAEGAAATGRRYQALAREHGIDYPAHHIDLPLALALSALGELEAARGLAASVVDYLSSQNAHGVPLGLAFHNLALISLAAQDVGGFERAAQRCAGLFEHSSNQALASKYRRLMREARKLEPPQGAARNSDHATQLDSDDGNTPGHLSVLFDTCSSVEERARLTASVLARHYQVETVFVYVPGSEIASLAATVGAHDPPAHLAELVGEYMATAFGDSKDASASATATGDASEAAAGDAALAEPLWKSAEGRCFYPIVLAHHEPSGLKVTAVAVVALAADTRFVYPSRVAAALSRLGTRSLATGSSLSRPG